MKLLLFLLLLPMSLIAQKKSPYVATIDEAKKDGISVGRLDSQYKSAVHMDTSKAVFKTEREQDSLTSAYGRFLQQFGKHLRDNHFFWKQTTRCWNRIYFRADGSVDYYLFNFKTELDSAELVKFEELFRSFAATHKIGIKAPVPFAQCSPVTYSDQ